MTEIFHSPGIWTFHRAERCRSTWHGLQVQGASLICDTYTILQPVIWLAPDSPGLGTESGAVCYQTLSTPPQINMVDGSGYETILCDLTIAQIQTIYALLTLQLQLHFTISIPCALKGQWQIKPLIANYVCCTLYMYINEIKLYAQYTQTALLSPIRWTIHALNTYNATPTVQDLPSFNVLGGLHDATIRLLWNE